LRVTTRTSEKGLLALLLAIGFVASTATGASANHQGDIKGTAAGVGTEVGGPIQNSCPNPLSPPEPLPPLPSLRGTLPRSDFNLLEQGVIEGFNANGQRVQLYSGPFTVNIVVANYIIDPEGTYINCVVPGPVPVESATISGPPVSQVGGTFQCGNLEGTFERRAFEHIRFVLSGGTCMVNGNVISSPGNISDDMTTHTITGLMTPCGFSPPELPPEPDPVPCTEDISSITQQAHTIT